MATNKYERAIEIIEQKAKQASEEVAILETNLTAAKLKSAELESILKDLKEIRIRTEVNLED